MENKIDLSIIIVSYNTKNILKDCLKSIFQNIKKINFEVWVADNASKDDSLKMIKSQFPKVGVIANKENVGFAKANNQAIKKSAGEYILLLNSDTFVLDENLYKLIDFMNNNSKTGACGPLVLNFDKTMQRQCKRGLPTLWNLFTYHSGLWKLFSKNKWWRKKFGGYFLLNMPDDKGCEVDQISGAAMIVRKNILKEVGLLNEKYVMYWEDTDWCFRIKKMGWKIYYVPFAKIIHYGGSGGTQLQANKNLWYFYRGAYLFYKNYLAPDYFFVTNLLFYIGNFSVYILKLGLNLFKKEKVIGSKKPK